MLMKTCRICGRELPDSEFYLCKSHKDGLASYCKECAKQEQRKWYDRTRKRPDEFVNKKGQICVICDVGKGRRIRLKWTEDMLRSLQEKYPMTLNTVLAAELKVSRTSLRRKAAELELMKEPEFKKKHLGEIATRIKQGQRSGKQWTTKYSKGHGAKPWTLGELYYLRAAFANTSDKELAAHFRCSVPTLRKKAASLGLKKNETSVRLRKMASMRKFWVEREKRASSQKPNEKAACL
jgi:Zn-dependent peptidase ImmA (M78 family)